MEKNYKRKMLVIGVLFLFLGASTTLSVSAMMGPWSENFDSYAAGSALEGQGGWHAWDANPTYTGYVSNAQSRSAPNSVEIAWWSTTVWTDEVHEYTDINSGIWTYTAWQYVPSTQVGNTYFILMNTYAVPHNNQDWSLQLVASASLGTIVDYNDVAATLPLVTDAWAEIKVVIDLDTDWQTVYYNGVILQPGKGWTDGAGTPGGALNLGAVDLFSDSAYSTSVYYDDMSVLPAGEALICDAGGPYTGEVSQAIPFTGFASGGTTPYTWAWTFGDGGTAAVQNPTHTYTTKGNYTVTLTVTDAATGTATDTATATITEPVLLPVLEIGTITGGFGVKASVKNTGEAAATNVVWKIALDGKLVFVGKSSTGTIATLAVAGNQAIKSKFILGFGKTNIDVTATCDEGVSAEATASGMVIGPFVLGVK
jgi:hypothetical protein